MKRGEANQLSQQGYDSARISHHRRPVAKRAHLTATTVLYPATSSNRAPIYSGVTLEEKEKKNIFMGRIRIQEQTRDLSLSLSQSRLDKLLYHKNCADITIYSKDSC